VCPCLRKVINLLTTHWLTAIRSRAVSVAVLSGQSLLALCPAGHHFPSSAPNITVPAGFLVWFLCLINQVRGRVVYFGPTGNACIDYLKGISNTQQPTKDPSSPLSHTGSTAPAVPLLNPIQKQQLADGSVVGLNPAEWLVDLFTQADREGRGGDFADVYDASSLKQVHRCHHSGQHHQYGRMGFYMPPDLSSVYPAVLNAL